MPKDVRCPPNHPSTHRWTLACCALVAGLGVAACEGDELGAGRDAGGALDSGASASSDAGDADAGGGGLDAGARPLDAGSSPIDAGDLPVDGGASPMDGGASPMDAGDVPSDAGGAPVDAGGAGRDAGSGPDAGGCAHQCPVVGDACAPDGVTLEQCTVDADGCRVLSATVCDLAHGYCDTQTNACACDPGWVASGASCVHTSTVPPDLVLVPAGRFTMGSPATEPWRYADEDQHEVVLTRDFYVSQHEVTQGEFMALMGWNTSYLRQCGADCPVDFLSWFDALVYANQRSRMEGLAPCYVLSNIGCERSTPSGATPMSCMNYTQQGIDTADVTLNGVNSVYECEGYRLPTEAEWEYAARAGTTSAFYSGPITNSANDPNLNLISWNYFNSGATAHPVGGLQPNPWGLYDMAGNVYEWTWDRYGPYQGDATDPRGAPTGLHRVLRGGGWYHNASYHRSAYRNYYAPGNRYFYFGMRVVRTAP